MNRSISIIIKNILKWYTHNSRNFPWRDTKDPYKIMIAEFMLHRTRAEQVVPVYLDFIKKYPDIYSLADAKPEEVKTVTNHLGLHWRSKHFIEAAKYLINNSGGKFPEEYNALRQIPGVGEYIAGAILTVSFNKPAAVVDSNIARFINRFWNLNLNGEIRRKRKIKEIADDLFHNPEPGKLLFALVDFTTAICKPGQPLCNECPLKVKCLYYLEKTNEK
ncbi:HhH-GPD family protein [Caldithrix abyssi DSM 13497]|uniref:A/G-specific DNA-adenine glycosylase n=1 Tax=Caldithrix abyssi DSM 13497 TaxID=880073 RepID=H1XUS1_CALAY|nr:DNA glycosylase [Caldithrix abyssi]APF17524.1 A/G-specific DNA-adenine glycosylase [Caldithrix abyssi DSM 13497]EHO41620.1 HhH-GPD family protein [Caldithrix abyssi DSM 13497]